MKKIFYLAFVVVVIIFISACSNASYVGHSINDEVEVYEQWREYKIPSIQDYNDKSYWFVRGIGKSYTSKINAANNAEQDALIRFVKYLGDSTGSVNKININVELQGFKVLEYKYFNHTNGKHYVVCLARVLRKLPITKR